MPPVSSAAGRCGAVRSRLERRMAAAPAIFPRSQLVPYVQECAGRGRCEGRPRPAGSRRVPSPPRRQPVGAADCSEGLLRPSAAQWPVCQARSARLGSVMALRAGLPGRPSAAARGRSCRAVPALFHTLTLNSPTMGAGNSDRAIYQREHRRGLLTSLHLCANVTCKLLTERYTSGQSQCKSHLSSTRLLLPGFLSSSELNRSADEVL